MGHRFIGAVNGQCVLNQIVGAQRQKVEVAQKGVHDQHGGRDFNHGPNFQLSVGHPLRLKLGARLLHQRQGLANFAQMRQHRNHHLHWPVRRRPVDGAQLADKHVRVSQAPPNGTQAERGIQMTLVLNSPIHGFVCTDVHRANGHGQALHAFHRLSVSKVLLLLIRQVGAMTAHK